MQFFQSFTDILPVTTKQWMTAIYQQFTNFALEFHGRVELESRDINSLERLLQEAQRQIEEATIRQRLEQELIDVQQQYIASLEADIEACQPKLQV